MPVTRYVSVNGRLRGEITSGTRTDYLTDALGSVTASVNSSAAVVNTYRHMPYGEQLAKTGSGADPRYLWTGDTGSRKTNLNRAQQYNVYRHYGSQHAAWTTVDPFYRLARDLKVYTYLLATSSIDPSGTHPISSRGPLPCSTQSRSKLLGCCLSYNVALANPGTKASIINCVSRVFPGTETIVETILRKLSGYCSKQDSICAYCVPDTGVVPPNTLPDGCYVLCGIAIAGTMFKDRWTIPSTTATIFGELPTARLTGCPLTPSSKPCERMRGTCNCGLFICAEAFKRKDFCCTLMHELVHCTGPSHQKAGEYNDFVYRIEECLAKHMAGLGCQ